MAQLYGSIIQISLFYDLFGILFYYYSLAPDRKLVPTVLTHAFRLGPGL